MPRVTVGVATASFEVAFAVVPGPPQSYRGGSLKTGR